MKQKIHPKWHDNCQVTCACGNTFVTGSVMPEIKVEICSACHPFFTGEMKFIDSLGRVERFKQKQAAAKKKKYVSKKQRKKAKKMTQDKQNTGPKTLREMLKKDAEKTDSHKETSSDKSPMEKRQH